VNNAGVTRDMLSMAMSPEDWEVVLNTNLKGAFNFVQAVQRSMIKQRHGRIINISSVIGLRMRSPLVTSPLIRPARYRKKFKTRFRNEFRSSASELRRTLRRRWLLRRCPKQVTLPVKCQSRCEIFNVADMRGHYSQWFVLTNGRHFLKTCSATRSESG
jgi:NAD(P)-dependent dehydrogenase (short-subunit alcohol dehydrogenase family)